jgi:hypothetical protein
MCANFCSEPHSHLIDYPKALRGFLSSREVTGLFGIHQTRSTGGFGYGGVLRFCAPGRLRLVSIAIAALLKERSA